VNKLSTKQQAINVYFFRSTFTHYFNLFPINELLEKELLKNMSYKYHWGNWGLINEGDITTLSYETPVYREANHKFASALREEILEMARSIVG